MTLLSALALIGLIVGPAVLVWIARQVERGEGVLLRDEHGPAVVILDGPTAEAHRRAAEQERVEQAIRAQGRRQTTWEVLRPGMLCFYRSTVQDSGWGILGAADVVEVNGVVVHGEKEGER